MEEKVFGRRYRATDKIGSGGMAEVYAAVDEVLGRTVAVKVMHAQYAADPSFVARFRQEAQAAANLSHPGIVNIYDWGQEGNTYYIVMEYVRGTDLKSLIEQRGPVDPLKAAEYGAQVCAALSVAHGYDIIHRDIKPHNIVLTPDGTVKVMDFGIARAGNTTMTQTGSVLGTAHYVSPEQAQGRTLTAASDLYSLGVVLYELVTGRMPFDADTPVAVALKHVNEPVTPPSQIRPGIPRSMEAVIMRAMAKDPRERYASAEEMRADLKRVASGGAVAMPAAAPAGMDETSVLPQIDGEDGRPRIRPIPEKRKKWPWVVGAIALVLIALLAAWALGVFDRDEGLRVPDLSGMTLEEAELRLNELELVLGEVSEAYSSEVATDLIMAQMPEADEPAEVGDAVDVVISLGVELFTLSDYSGLAEEEAVRMLRADGFDLDTVQREFSTSVADGLVIRTEPPAGTQLPAGTRLILVVSRGTELARVPNVVGQTRAEAEAAIREAGFQVRVNEAFNDTVEAGRVISQDPDGGVSIDAGSTITINISKGVEQIEVPNVIGRSESEARQALTGAGFRVTVNYQTSPDDGRVLTQDPVPGAKGRRGDTVTIWVGRAPDEPDIEM